VVEAKLNSQPETLKVSRVRNNFLLEFTSKVEKEQRNSFEVCLKSKDDRDYQVVFIFMGNLNYLPEGEQVHLKGTSNVTFMSNGLAVLEVDECENRAALTLTS
jgi:hypothetical protein